MPRFQARSWQRLRLSALGTWSNVPSPVPIWQTSERVSQSARERQRQRVGPGLSQRDARYTLNTGGIRVCRSHTPRAFDRTPRYCTPSTSRCLPPPPLGKETATLRLCPPANCPGIFAERSTLTRCYHKARSEPLHYHCIVVHATDASSDTTRRLLCKHCLRPPSLHLGKHLTTWRIDHVCLLPGRRSHLHLPANRLHASVTTSAVWCIDCEDIHAQASQTRATLPRHRLSRRYPSFAQLSYPNRFATSILLGKQEHGRHQQYTV